MLDQLKNLDTTLFLFLNSKHNSFFDVIMYWASNTWIWVPLYAFLLYLLIKAFGRKSILLILLCAIMITLSDQLSSSLIKNLVMRPRPCHEALLQDKIHLVNGECGGEFGFISSHASNSFALALFLILIKPHRRRGICIILFCYALLVSYSRIYLGVHYPGDIFGGILLGALLSIIFVSIYNKLVDT